MKRIGYIVLVMLLGVGISVFADTSVLLDFNTLTADSSTGENTATIIDFSAQAGTGFTADERAAMKTSLAIDNWEVTLSQSSQTVTNQTDSMVKAVTVNSDASKFAGDTVMGIRVHFPSQPFNSYAIIQPPFQIPAYMQKTTLNADGTLSTDNTDTRGTKYDGYGVVKNVGVIKSITVNVFGSNYPNGFGIILEDQNNVQQNIFLGYLNFDGWRTITWQNPNYIDDVRNRNVQSFPLYPQSEPMRKLVGFVVYKDAAQEGGDFITYIKDVSLTYDKAVLNPQRDINEEQVWGILSAREEARRTAEFNRLGNLQVLRYLEQKKMDQSSQAQGQSQ